MVSHTKTTLNIDDTVMARLRAEAARQRKTMSELVEAALRLLLQNKPAGDKKKRAALPRYHGGRPNIDLADRDQLLRAMEERG